MAGKRFSGGAALGLSPVHPPLPIGSMLGIVNRGSSGTMQGDGDGEALPLGILILLFNMGASGAVYGRPSGFPQ